ncbi:hypothetical protein MRB53_034920 [Persea americana]|uniref:Uncharacterized protein n=1 Tax=Persea americana TaxID=3435 RepID=A0ACC2K353_PERAE|nr:hypothetical protein MRB53_034920 [Persea americana]
MDAHSSPSSLTVLAISYLNRASGQEANLPPPESVHHLLHFLHLYLHFIDDLGKCLLCTNTFLDAERFPG